jgi:molybdopterin-guanine dinucleotide biosynthesis protein A
MTCGKPAAIILTGGRSSRMGRPKALLLFDGEPLIVHLQHISVGCDLVATMTKPALKVLRAKRSGGSEFMWRCALVFQNVY